MNGGINTFAYVEGNPVGHVDPFGLYVGVDDAIAVGIGAAVGLIGQGVGDLASGNLSGWEDYTAAAIGGAAGGEAFLYTGPIGAGLIGAGLIGGAVTNATKQGLKNIAGKQCGFSTDGFVFDTALGGLTGFIPGVPKSGINRGRGSWGAVSKRAMTRLKKGQISRIRGKTFAKFFGVNVWDGTGGIGAGVVAGTGAQTIGIGDTCDCQ